MGLIIRYWSLIIVLAVVAHAAISTPVANIITPVPQKYSFQSGNIKFCQASLNTSTTTKSVLLQDAIARFKQNIFKFGSGSSSNVYSITISVTTQSDSETLDFGVDESYTIQSDLQRSSGQISVAAKTVFGALRALESLKQLVIYDDINDIYTLYGMPFSISDSPRFPWRGLLIDSSRHFLEVPTILRTIDAMAIVKMNTLHWHITDAQSFPIQSAKYPELAKKGAYRFPAATYSAKQVHHIVKYAKDRGIRVLAEFDVPGHTASWGLGDPSLVAQCPGHLASNVNNVPLDVTQDHTLEVVRQFIQEMTSEFFSDSFIHTGGDEVVGSCWTSNSTILAWMKAHNIASASQLQTYFEKRVESFARESWNRTVVFWQDVFDNAGNTKFDSSRTVFQVWRSQEEMQSITAAGYRAIFSAAWYLDKYHPNGDPNVYHFWDTWQSMYPVDPQAGLTAAQARLVLGGEAAMWGEYVDSATLDPQVWPRAAAIAERLWSDASVNDLADAQRRITPLSCFLRQNGISSVPLGPGYCPVPQMSV